ncbi:MAG: hypothetical protein KBS91_03925 [Firmicutes bacterium]|nr:hypothetical protein [Candidatus Caballimonas caccae]
MTEYSLINYGISIYEVYGIAWGIILVLGTCLLTIPFNYLFKFAFNKLQKKYIDDKAEDKEDKVYLAKVQMIRRIRKTLVIVVVFIIAMAFELLYCKIRHQEIVWKNVPVNALPISLCAMIAWAGVKIVGQIGVYPCFVKLVSIFKDPIREEINKLDLPKGLGDLIYVQVCEYIEKTDVSNVDMCIQNEAQVIAKAQQLLNGFVENDKLQIKAKQIVDCIKEKYVK